MVANVNSGEELATRDNFAFGIAMAAGIVALALMLTGAVSGEASATFVSEIVNVLAYGVLGVLLIKVGRLVQDRIVLRGIAIQDEIKSGNLAAAFVDAANTLATGLVLRAVMLWVESDTISGLISVLAAFFFTQFLLAVVSKYRQPQAFCAWKTYSHSSTLLRPINSGKADFWARRWVICRS